MEQSKIDSFIAMNASKLPQYKLGLIKEVLAKVDEEKAAAVLYQDFQDPSTLLIISILCGTLGIDRFMTGEVGLGVLKLLTCGGCYIWWLIDMVNAQERAREYNYKKLVNALMMQGVTGLY